MRTCTYAHLKAHAEISHVLTYIFAKGTCYLLAYASVIIKKQSSYSGNMPYFNAGWHGSRAETTKNVY